MCRQFILAVLSLFIVVSAFSVAKSKDPYPPASIEIYTMQTPKMPPGTITDGLLMEHSCSYTPPWSGDSHLF